jgi:hypothetical protein
MTRFTRRGKALWLSLVFVELVLIWQMRPAQPLAETRAESRVADGFWPWEWTFFRGPRFPTPIGPTPRRRGGVVIS